MRDYQVVWRITIPGDSPEGAVREARAIQQDPDSLATTFEVTPAVSTCDADRQVVLIDLENHDTPWNPPPCDWCGGEMDVIGDSYGSYVITGCTKCHHEVQAVPFSQGED